jgi:hypothetical protein
MTPWLLLTITLAFAYLTYDAISLIAPPLPYSEIAKGLGQDLSYMSLSQQEKLSQYPHRYRLGDINQTSWAFGLITFGFALATICAFID